MVFVPLWCYGCLTLALVFGLDCVSARTGGGPGGDGPEKAKDASTTDNEQEQDVISPVFLRKLLPDAVVTPMFGSDGVWHVVYELEMINIASTLSTKVKKLDIYPAGDEENIVASFKGKNLTDYFSVLGTTNGTNATGPSQVGVFWLNVEFESREAIPKVIAHRLTYDAIDAASGTVTITNGVTLGGFPHIPVGAPPYNIPIILKHPPLLGNNYVAGDACCSSPTHRRELLPINGELRLSQRFATDWERVGNNRIQKSAESDGLNVEDFLIYGENVYAVADGTVVSSENTLPNQQPLSWPVGLPAKDASGNHIILDIEDKGFYALYGHMQPGSVRFQAGDKVKTGDVIGLVGSSGNSLAPHMHFQLMTEPLPLGSDGLPFGWEYFELTSVMGSRDEFNDAEDRNIAFTTTVNTSRADTPGPRRDAYAMQLAIVNFVAPPYPAAGGKKKTKKRKRAPMNPSESKD